MASLVDGAGAGVGRTMVLRFGWAQTSLQDPALRRLLKFLHTIGAAGFTGGLAALAVMTMLGPAGGGVAGGIPVGAIARIAAWIIGPSMVLTVIAGLLAIAVTPAFHDAGWVWIKAATGILVLEGGLHVLELVQEQARAGGAGIDLGTATRLLAAEGNTLWVLLAVSFANIALAIWRPRLHRRRR